MTIHPLVYRPSKKLQMLNRVRAVKQQTQCLFILRFASKCDQSGISFPNRTFLHEIILNSA